MSGRWGDYLCFSNGGLYWSNVNAAETDRVSITVSSSCSFSNEQIPSDTEHSATIFNNEYYPDIGTTTFKTYCNDNGGYAVYAIGYSGDQYGATSMIHSVDTTYNFNTGTATSGANSNWAMKLIPVTGLYRPTIQSDTSGTFANYHIVPSTYTKVATFPSTTDIPASNSTGTGSAFQSTYAVFISPTQVAGIYTGKVRYTLIHPMDESAPPEPRPTTAGYINYYANASTAEGTMGRQSAADGATVTLFASNFSRTGYGFADWSDAFDYATNPNANFYGPNEDITVPEGTTANGLALYAVWIKSEGTFQDSAKTTSVCNSLTAASTSGTRTLASVSALTDQRDNDTYAIAKLADGKCWMIENLRLADTHEENNTTVPTTLTTTNTNNPLNDNNPTNPTVTLKHNYADTQTFTNLSPTSNVAYDADTAPDGWCSTSSAACDEQSRLRTDSTTNRISYSTTQTMTTRANLYSYGNYYNWYSATAGRGTYSKASGNTEGDLCPAGWHLPISGRKASIAISDFWILSRAVIGVDPANFADDYFYYTENPEGVNASKLMRSYPNNFLNSGLLNGDSFSNRGSIGYYWSSTAYNKNNAYRLNITSSDVYPGTSYSVKYGGRSVRCLAAQ